MNINYINKVLSGDSISADTLKILYNFDNRNGPFVANEIYSGITQYEVSPNLVVYKEYLPGIFLSCYSVENQNVYSSGIFSGNTLLKISDNILDDRFTLFLNYSNSQKCNFIYNSTGKNETLAYICSENNSIYPFELTIGINNANRIFLEFSGSTGLNHQEVYRKTILHEPADQNIISLGINRDLLSLSYHDFIEEEQHTKDSRLNLNYFNQSKNIYFGNKPSGKIDNFNTGFYGAIDDILIFNEYISPSIGQKIALNFIKTGEFVTGIVKNIVTYNIINSGYINTTGIIGTGITGYQNVLYQQINLDCGDNCNFYIKSGITGFLTGETIDYKIVEQAIIESSTGELVIDYYDLDYALKFSKNKVIFNQSIDNKDIFEINYYDKFNNVKPLSYSPDFSIYFSNETLTGNKFMLFINGVNVDYSSYIFLSGSDNKFKLANQTKDDNDLVKYYKTDDLHAFWDTVYTGGFNSDLDAFAEFSANDKLNFYLNGVKLISGDNIYYSYVDGMNGEILPAYRIYFPTGTPTGNFYVVKDYYTDFEIGSGIQKINAKNYISKNIWLNGILQEQGDKYILSSCVNNSLYGDKSLILSNENIFDQGYFRFNSGQQTDADLDYDALKYLAKTNITGNTQKYQINSFVKELKRVNLWDKFENLWIFREGYNLSSGTSGFLDLKNINFSGYISNPIFNVNYSTSGYLFPIDNSRFNLSSNLKFTGANISMFSVIESITKIYPHLPFQTLLGPETYFQNGFRFGIFGTLNFRKGFSLWTNESVPSNGFNVNTNFSGQSSKYSFLSAGIQNSGTGFIRVNNEPASISSGGYKEFAGSINTFPYLAGGTNILSQRIAFFGISKENILDYHSTLRNIAKNTIYSDLDF